MAVSNSNKDEVRPQQTVEIDADELDFCIQRMQEGLSLLKRIRKEQRGVEIEPEEEKYTLVIRQARADCSLTDIAWNVTLAGELNNFSSAAFTAKLRRGFGAINAFEVKQGGMEFGVINRHADVPTEVIIKRILEREALLSVERI